MPSLSKFPSLPVELGAMLLPDVQLFPGSLLPLHIFEPRYAQMLSASLASHRMMAIACHEGQEEELHAIGGAGIIRACVETEDGTSNLILQGVSRVRYSSWVQVQPYPIAKIEVLESISDCPEICTALARRIAEACEKLQNNGVQFPDHLKTYLSRIDDPGLLSDVIAFTVVPSSELRQTLMEELQVEVRLQLVLEHLQSWLKHGS